MPPPSQRQPQLQGGRGQARGSGAGPADVPRGWRAAGEFLHGGERAGLVRLAVLQQVVQKRDACRQTKRERDASCPLTLPSAQEESNSDCRARTRKTVSRARDGVRTFLPGGLGVTQREQ